MARKSSGEIVLPDEPMTADEWLTSADPRRMLAFLRERVSERKLRLFACACCRRHWALLSDAGRSLAQ